MAEQRAFATEETVGIKLITAARMFLGKTVGFALITADRMFSREQKILHTDRYALFIYKIRTDKISSSTESKTRFRAVSKTSTSAKTKSYPACGWYLKLPPLRKLNHIPLAGGT